MGGKEHSRLNGEIALLNQQNDRYKIRLVAADGAEKVLPLADIVRAYPANQVTFWDKLAIYKSRWWEFLSDEPRNINSEGGVLPAIWGTAAMTLLMSLVVVPFGVLAALYLREYAKAGPVVSAVRIAVNNLAGVPSIVFGVFGLGFFCYIIGASIDALLFESSLPSPTFGTGGVLWASLTLALLTRAGRHRRHRGGARGRTGLDAGGILRLRSEQVADHPPHRPAAGHAGHYDGHDPGDGARRRRSGPTHAGRCREAGAQPPGRCASSPTSTCSAASCTWAFTFTTSASRARTVSRPSRWCLLPPCC